MWSTAANFRHQIAMWKRALLQASLLVSLILTGCEEDLCKSAAPSFEVKMEWQAKVSISEVSQVQAEVLAAGLEKKLNLDSTPLKTQGFTSFVVEVGDLGRDGYIGVVRLAALTADGKVLARGVVDFEASGDACNFLTIPLSEETCAPVCEGKACGADDGCGRPCLSGPCIAGQRCEAGVCICDEGTCPDGCCQDNSCFEGTSDDHCGGQGQACSDCLAQQLACSGEKVCISCTPQCGGKLCGADNGCGGTCAQGDCPSGQECIGGHCTCSGLSCPDGCCSQDEFCLSGHTDNNCGADGDLCSTCATPGQVCRDQACKSCLPQCSGCGMSDGCGGTCACPDGQDCDNGSCVPVECRRCCDNCDCLTQCEIWGAMGGFCAHPGSSDPAQCCDCNPLSSGKAAIGFLDSVSNGLASGWACDPDDPWESIEVHIYVGIPSGQPGASIQGSIWANQPNGTNPGIEDICLGGGFHRFRYQIPNWSSKVGQDVFAYGISVQGGPNSLLQPGGLTL